MFNLHVVSALRILRCKEVHSDSALASLRYHANSISLRGPDSIPTMPFRVPLNTPRCLSTPLWIALPTKRLGYFQLRKREPANVSIHTAAQTHFFRACSICCSITWRKYAAAVAGWANRRISSNRCRGTRTMQSSAMYAIVSTITPICQ